jgi:putative SOS response-associated peptidase YedK
MCVNFIPAHARDVQRLVDAARPLGDYPASTYPGYAAPVIRQKAGHGNALRVDLATFGLIPSWSKDRSMAKHTYNARSETVHEKPSYRTPWRMRQFCLVPMQEFSEPCWETGKAVKWSIRRQDRQPFTVAAIWDRWTDPATGEIVGSFSMLTINGDGHPIMGRFHKSGDERRSLVVVAPDAWTKWLSASTEEARAMLQPMAVDEFEGVAAAQS